MTPQAYSLIGTMVSPSGQMFSESTRVAIVSKWRLGNTVGRVYLPPLHQKFRFISPRSGTPERCPGLANTVEAKKAALRTAAVRYIAKGIKCWSARVICFVCRDLVHQGTSGLRSKVKRQGHRMNGRSAMKKLCEYTKWSDDRNRMRYLYLSKEFEGSSNHAYPKQPSSSFNMEVLLIFVSLMLLSTQKLNYAVETVKLCQGNMCYRWCGRTSSQRASNMGRQNKSISQSPVYTPGNLALCAVSLVATNLRKILTAISDICRYLNGGIAQWVIIGGTEVIARESRR